MGLIAILVLGCNHLVAVGKHFLYRCTYLYRHTYMHIFWGIGGRYSHLPSCAQREGPEDHCSWAGCSSARPHHVCLTCRHPTPHLSCFLPETRAEGLPGCPHSVLLPHCSPHRSGAWPPPGLVTVTHRGLGREPAKPVLG